MLEKNPVFRTPEGEAQNYSAYEAVLKQWPVPYEELYISTRYSSNKFQSGAGVRGLDCGFVQRLADRKYLYGGEFVRGFPDP